MIEVYSDASCCYERQIGCYAYIVKCDGKTFRKGGKIPRCRNSNDAELYAILKAIELLCILSPEGGTVTFWTDSLHSIKIIYGDKQYKVADKILELLNLINITWTINYVPRNSLPELAWCDTKTKEYYDT